MVATHLLCSLNLNLGSWGYLSRVITLALLHPESLRLYMGESVVKYLKFAIVQPEKLITSVQ